MNEDNHQQHRKPPSPLPVGRQPPSPLTMSRQPPSPLFTYHQRPRTGVIPPPLLSPGMTDTKDPAGRQGSIPEGSPRRRSLTYAEAGIPARRRSLAYADLMAVFYPPNILRQPTVTDTPFECPEWEGVSDSALSHIPIDEPGVASWEPTLERAIKSIVSIKAQCVRSFDTETSGTYTATGFVVDAEAGLILSNRHVVNPGPIVAQAIFVNYEEVELQPVYRDPVHDFGFFR
ncbi:hypothetical protein GGI24_004752, partial [Coemansia furcata]